MHIIDENPEAKLHVRIQRWFQERIRRWLGIEQDQQQFIALIQEFGQKQVELAAKSGLTARRLKFHESSVESLRYSAEKYEREVVHRVPQSVVGVKDNGLVKESGRIMLLHPPKNGAA
jgi:hypothetical protein